MHDAAVVRERERRRRPAGARRAPPRIETRLRSPQDCRPVLAGEALHHEVGARRPRRRRRGCSRRAGGPGVAATRPSRTKRARIASSRVRCSCSTLMATGLPSPAWIPSKTLAMAPWPMSAPISYCPRRAPSAARCASTSQACRNPGPRDPEALPTGYGEAALSSTGTPAKVFPAKGSKKPEKKSRRAPLSRKSRSGACVYTSWQCAFPEQLAKVGALVGAFVVASFLAFHLHGRAARAVGGAHAGDRRGQQLGGPRQPAPYDLTQLKVVNEVLKTIRDRYVDPKRVKPKEMLLSALNYVQQDVAQVIVIHDESEPDQVKVRVDTQEKEFRVDDVQRPLGRERAPARRLRLRAGRPARAPRSTCATSSTRPATACSTRSTRTSVLLSPDAYKEMNLSTQRPVRRPRHRHLDPRPAAHRDEPDAGRRRPGARGIKKYDRIVKINGESTLNMGLNEAVQPPARRAGHEGHGLASTATGPRAGAGAKPFELTREVIHVASRRAQAARRRHRLRAAQAVPGEHDDRPRGRARRHEEERRAQGARARSARQPRRAARPGGEGRRQVRQPRGPSSPRSATRARGARRRSRTARGRSRTTRSRVLVNGIERERERDRRRRAEEPRPRGHHRRDDVRQGERAARLHRPAGQGGAQADHRAVPDRAGRRLDPGRRRDAGHRARPDDGRPAGDGPHGRHRRRSRSATSRARLSNVRAQGGAQPARRSCSTTCR